MVIKKLEVVDDGEGQLQLECLNEFVQLLRDQPDLIPPSSEWMGLCENFTISLAHLSVPENEAELCTFLQYLHNIEKFVKDLLQNSDNSVKQVISFTVLKRITQSLGYAEVGPAVLSLLCLLNDNEVPPVIRWLVQDASRQGLSGVLSLRGLFSQMLGWLTTWRYSPFLYHWVLGIIQGLQVQEEYKILVEVSLQHIEGLMDALLAPHPISRNVAPVLFLILASMRETSLALDKIAPKVPTVIAMLASNPTSRTNLQCLVDIVSSLIDHQKEIKASNNKYKSVNQAYKYAEIIACLDQHIANKNCPLLNVKVWVHVTVTKDNNTLTHKHYRKNGLANLGNTCYVNSVLQALLVTKHFSNAVLMRMFHIPYYFNLGQLFTSMLYSLKPIQDTHHFFDLVKPPTFFLGTQHDSSEFLSHLFELLHRRELNIPMPYEKLDEMGTRALAPSQSIDHVTGYLISPSKKRKLLTGQNSKPSLDYYKKSPKKVYPPKTTKTKLDETINSKNAVAGSSSHQSESRNDNSDQPCSSNSISMKMHAQSTDRATLIQTLFEGTQVTKVECLDCRRTSVHRDMFRDLQLAFPDLKSGEHSVQSLIDYYCSAEKLSDNNQYHCDDCQGLRDAQRSVVIEHPPKYLILVLKNFRFNPCEQQNDKLIHPIYQTRTISVPLLWPERSHADYHLYAGVVHSGSSLDSGHYYCYAEDDGSWHKFNDHYVDPSSESELDTLPRSTTPYILFYRRSDVDTLPTVNFTDLPEHLAELIEEEQYSNSNKTMSTCSDSSLEKNM